MQAKWNSLKICKDEKTAPLITVQLFFTNTRLSILNGIVLAFKSSLLYGAMKQQQKSLLASLCRTDSIRFIVIDGCERNGHILLFSRVTGIAGE